MPPSAITKRFGAVVRAYRLKAGFSQEALADLAALHVTYISLVERGRRNPTLDVANRIAAALKTPLGRLIDACEDLPGED